MESIETTYWLAAAHIALAVIAFAATARPLISTYHWLLLVSFIAFGVRPALAASVGGYTNYDSGIGWYAYNYGLLYQLLFMSCLSATYVAMYLLHRPRVRPIERVPGPTDFLVLFVLGLLALLILHVVSRGAWLPGVRVGTINTAVPGGKFIFPFAVMSFSLLIPVGLIGCMRRGGIRWWTALVGTAAALIALSLLYMRGMVITGVLLVLWALDKNGKLKARYLAVGLLAVFLIGQVLRPLGSYIVARYYLRSDDAVLAVAASAAEALGPAEKARALFLFTTNLDIADSWPVVINYVETNGFAEGRSFIAIPARFAGTKFRLASGYLTGSDLVNAFFYGSLYEQQSFGFQVTLANELYLNFGVAGLLLGILPGLVTWLADDWLRRRKTISLAVLFIAFICFRGFVNELALTVQWAAGALLLCLLAEVLTRLRLRREAGNLRGRSPEPSNA